MSPMSIQGLQLLFLVLHLILKMGLPVNYENFDLKRLLALQVF